MSGVPVPGYWHDKAGCCCSYKRTQSLEPLKATLASLGVPQHLHNGAMCTFLLLLAVLATKVVMRRFLLLLAMLALQLWSQWARCTSLPLHTCMLMLIAV